MPPQGRFIDMSRLQRAKKEYNLVMLHPDEHTGQASSESWTAEASVEQMRNEFVGWEPRYVNLFPETSEARLILVASVF